MSGPAKMCLDFIEKSMLSKSHECFIFSSVNFKQEHEVECETKMRNVIFSFFWVDNFIFMKRTFHCLETNVFSKLFTFKIFFFSSNFNLKYV